MTEIKEFRDEYFFLSNFFQDSDRTVEHYFQAAKAATEEEYLWVLSSPSPATSKSRGRQVQMRDDWEQVKDAVMFELLVKKFHNPKLSQMLLDTGTATLIEGNTWGDKYWGVDLRTGEGQNRLGNLLMLLRSQKFRIKSISQVKSLD